MKIDLLPFLRNEGLPFGVLAARDGSTEEFGDPSKVTWRGVVDTYIHGDRAALFDYLEANVLPQMVSQGCTVCVFCLPTKDLALALFCDRDEDVLSMAKWSRALNQRLLEYLG